MEVIKEIEGCRNCPFYGNSMDGLYCGHPYWKDKGAYDCHIDFNATVNGIPEECPLKIHEISTVIRLKDN